MKLRVKIRVQEQCAARDRGTVFRQDQQMTTTPRDALVQVVGPTDDWILGRLAELLARKLPYAEFVPWKPQPDSVARLAYYVNYALYHGPSGLIDIGFCPAIHSGSVGGTGAASDPKIRF